MDCDNHDPILPPISYKDKLTGGSDPTKDDDLLSLDDDDIDLLEEDIETGVADGIPFITFSDRVQELSIKSMDFTLVLKVLGRRVGYTTLFNRISNIWKPSHQIKLIDIENDYYLVKFSSRSDYIHALTDGPWTIFGHYITIEPWSVDFDAMQEHPSRIMAWVCLPGLPITWYKRSLIEAIGARIGSVVKIDYQTDYGRRGKFARMAVNINLGKPLVSKIAINGKIQCVEYEPLPMVCFKCGLYGHVSDLCSRVADAEVVDATHACPKGPIKVVTEEAYGPWMLVERKQRRPPKNVRPSTPPSRSVPPHESRFNPIFIDEDVVTDYDCLRVSSDAPQLVRDLNNAPVPPAMINGAPSASTNPVPITANDAPPSKEYEYYPSSRIASSSRMPTERSSSATLNPAKHGAMVLSSNSAPIIIAKSPPKRNASSTASTLREPTVVVSEPHLSGDSPIDAIVSFSAAASAWNHEIFGSIGRNKKIIMARLRGVQRCLDQRRTKGLIKLEQNLLDELESLLDYEEQLWKQKSRMDWIKLGDRNTNFFHSKAIIRKRRKAISRLKVNSDEWCDNESLLRSAATNYFKDLFALTGPPPAAYPISGCFPALDVVVSGSLTRIPLDVEIKDALFFYGSA
ncbi:hypothetical protein GQ457_09G007220 [Hibiscus cannabinus]